MVCGKCQKLSKTTLATPAVKKKADMYYGSPASSSAASGSSKKSSTLGQTGVSKSKLLSKSATNPYAAYASSCDKCKTRVSQGYKFCLGCSYKANACAMCGKSNSKTKAAGAAPVISGQKFSAK